MDAFVLIYHAEELQLCKTDLDLPGLKHQLSMLQILSKSEVKSLKTITEVTNVRTICFIMADISLCKEML